MSTEWIKAGLRRSGRTQQELAACLDLAPSGISRLLNGKRELKAKEVEAIAAFLGVDPAFGMAAAGSAEPGRTPLGPTEASPAASPAQHHEVPPVAAMARDVPVLGTAVGGASGSFAFNGETIDFVRRPPGLGGSSQAFALYVAGDSMAPRYEEGEVIFIHPGRPPLPGCDVVVELAERNGDPGACFLKRLVRRSEENIVLAQFNPAKEITIERAAVKAVYRVLNAGELLGI